MTLEQLKLGLKTWLGLSCKRSILAVYDYSAQINIALGIPEFKQVNASKVQVGIQEIRDWVSVKRSEYESGLLAIDTLKDLSILEMAAPDGEEFGFSPIKCIELKGGDVDSAMKAYVADFLPGLTDEQLLSVAVYLQGVRFE